MYKWLIPTILAIILVAGLVTFGQSQFKQVQSRSGASVLLQTQPPVQLITPSLAQPTIELPPSPHATITPFTVGTVRPLRTSIPGTMSEQEMDALKRSVMATAEAEGSRTVALSGPRTRGSTITIAGRRITLPPDAWVESYIVAGTCAGPCPELPLYQIKRGNSIISVGIPTGRINGEQVALGEEGTFDFLKEALR
jgi:hypothetical protein